MRPVLLGISNPKRMVLGKLSFLAIRETPQAPLTNLAAPPRPTRPPPRIWKIIMQQKFDPFHQPRIDNLFILRCRGPTCLCFPPRKRSRGRAKPREKFEDCFFSRPSIRPQNGAPHPSPQVLDHPQKKGIMIIPRLFPSFGPNNGPDVRFFSAIFWARESLFKPLSFFWGFFGGSWQWRGPFWPKICKSIIA
ncbi:MAG: hypothetical protein CM15mP46_4850 [Alphaproteobacteria bacterium]|nr:MAG: hypothetical protein CM15mP46_4850 [Alphaproteobacteria bacterium]